MQKMMTLSLSPSPSTSLSSPSPPSLFLSLPLSLCLPVGIPVVFFWANVYRLLPIFNGAHCSRKWSAVHFCFHPVKCSIMISVAGCNTFSRYYLALLLLLLCAHHVIFLLIVPISVRSAICLSPSICSFCSMSL